VSSSLMSPQEHTARVTHLPAESQPSIRHGKGRQTRACAQLTIPPQHTHTHTHTHTHRHTHTHTHTPSGGHGGTSPGGGGST
jgi:hypothetical protein